MTGLVIDLFAGGGGASVGIEAALGRPVDIAINHDQIALAVHKANHPKTLHLEADVWEVKPLDATGGRPVDVLWASPDCTHFSVAKGDVPRRQDIRSLAWVVTKWAKAVRPAVIFVENVSEFRGWGPLGQDGRPDKSRMGETFARWKARLENQGYKVDYRVIDASLHGAPTRRRRLFIVARRDGRSITWPMPTHGPGLFTEPLRTAAECIDWSIPCPSIFERSKPLAEKTLWRIAQGIRRFVLESPRPFIVKFRHDSTGAPVDAPLPTVTAGGQARPSRPATGNPLGVVVPSLVEMNHSNAPHGADEPLGVVTTQHNRFNLVAPSLVKVNHGGDDARGEAATEPLTTVTATQRGHALVAPTLIQTGYGERDGQRPRSLDIEAPLGTAVAGGQKHALVAAFLAKHFGGVVGQEVEMPASTITAVDHHALVSATMVEPGQRHGRGQKPADDPLSTVVAKDRHALAAVALAKFRGTDPAQPGSGPVTDPLPVISAGGIHVAEVRAFLTAYYGDDATSGQSLFEPSRTITSKHRLGLVTVEGTEYQIVDIGMRMLEPHELLRAQFGRFAADYDLSAARTKSAKVRLIGNSVCPEVAEAIVRANFAVETSARRTA